MYNKSLTQNMLPPLAKLSLSEIGAKRKFGDADGTEAEKLLETFKGLTEDSGSSIDWVLALSNIQFDMLLSVRLYTGSLYKIMARVFYDSSVEDDSDLEYHLVYPDAKSTVQILLESEGKDHIIQGLYFAICNAKRRAPEKMNGPLLVNGFGEMIHLVMLEERFRICVAESLTNYVHADGTDTIFADFSMMEKVMERISGKGLHFQELVEVEEFRDAYLINPGTLAEDALEDFWFGMRHIASALKSFIYDSKVVVEGVPMPVYRGMKEDFDDLLAEESFVSVSRSEDVSRHFTKNGDLDWEYDDVGAPNQCCMMRMSLLPGTPYLDMDAALENSNGWGYALGEKELLLPPGLKYSPGPDGGHREQPAMFPEEIDESNDPDNGKLDIERNYDVTYWVARSN